MVYHGTFCDTLLIMDWMHILKESIEYMEGHLLQRDIADDVADSVNISPYYFQKGFALLTGYSISEYIRNRRLYLAALEVLNNKNKIIDLSYKYGYDTPESFTKAFRRFHGLSPAQLRKEPFKLKTFLPLQLSLSVKGGDLLDYRIEEMESFKLIGWQHRFDYKNAYQEIPNFWKKCFLERQEKGCLGSFAVSIDRTGDTASFDYLIAGEYRENAIPEGCRIIEIPSFSFAKFRCVGPMPAAIQAVNTRIFNEWLPGNSRYEISAGYNIEKYSPGDIYDSGYQSEVWIPVREL